MPDAVIGSVAWELDLDDKKFKKGVASASNEIKGLGGSIEKAAAGSQVFAAGLAAIGTGLVAFGVKSVKAFNESEQVTARLTKLILNQTDATQENVDALKGQAIAMQRVTTYGDDLVMVAQSQLATFDLSSDAIQKVIPGFLDMMAAERGVAISMEEMKNQANGLGKALVGQTDMLVKQGFQFTELQKEILKTGTESERLQVITDVMGKTYGGLAATLRDTFQGQMIVAQNTFGDFMELIGQAITERLTPLVAAINKWAESMGGPEGMMQKLNELGKTMNEWMPVIVGVIVFGLVPALASAAIAMWALVAPILPFIAAGAALGLVVKVLVDQMGGWDATMRKLALGFDIVREKWDALIANLRDGVKFIRENTAPVQSFFGNIMGKASLGFDTIFGGKRALGGSVFPNRAYLVGEQGPEMFVPNTSGDIIPNGGGSSVFNFYVSEKVDMPYVLDQVSAHLGMKGLQANAGIS